MTPGAAACPKCRSRLPGALCNLSEAAPCPACRASILVEVFPALFQAPVAGPAAEPIIEEGTAGCFYHEQKKAVTHCDACGRFLCALCDVDFHGRHICPGCLQAGKKKGGLAALDSHRTLWDSAALVVGVAPLIVWPATLVTAPLAIARAGISFFKPGSLVRRTRWRSVLAIGFSILELLAWAWFLFFRHSGP